MDTCIDVRPLVVDDLPYVARFHRESWLSVHQEKVPEEKINQLTLDYFFDTWQQVIKDTDRYNLVAVNKAMPVGYISYVRSEKAGRWELIGLYISPEMANRGCGTQLFAAMLEHITRQDTQKLVVWVMQDNLTAIRFYEKQGMRPSGKARHTKHDFFAFDEMQMVLYLSQ